MFKFEKNKSFEKNCCIVFHLILLFYHPITNWMPFFTFFVHPLWPIWCILKICQIYEWYLQCRASICWWDALQREGGIYFAEGGRVYIWVIFALSPKPINSLRAFIRNFTPAIWVYFGRWVNWYAISWALFLTITFFISRWKLEETLMYAIL